MILSQFLTSGNSNTTSSSSADVLAKVSKIMQAQNTGAPKLNAALSSDTTMLSGLGKLLNALTTFQSAAKSLFNTGSSPSLAAKDPALLTKNITNLVSHYNTLSASLSGLQKGDLKADGSVQRIQSQLDRIFKSATSGTAGGSYASPGSIGISTQKNGTLVIDATKLQNAVTKNPDGVAQLFTNGGKGIADTLVSQIQGMVGTTGSIQKETTAINKDIAVLNAKKSSLEKALTAQANALVKMYSQQSPSASSTGNLTLFDMLGQ